MTVKRFATLVFASMFTIALVVSAHAQVVDGTADAVYGPPLSVQDTQTGFGDANMGVIDYANGSELDAAYGSIGGGYLFLLLAGNLESNFNKLEIFIDAGQAGGQNRLLGSNSNQGGFLRMADDGSGNGLTFDAGFNADTWISPTGGGGPYALYVDYVGIGTGNGYYLGQGGAVQVGGNLTGGNAPGVDPSLGVKVTINNSNAAGVGGAAPSPGSGAGVTTGVEVAVPLALLGNPTGCVKVCAFVNGASHDYLSNQVLGPATGAGNLAEPRAVNFASLGGNQYFTVCPGVTPATSSTWGGLKTLYR